MASSTGTTTNDYASALDLNTVNCGSISIILKNTHETNALKYKVLAAVDYDDGSQEEEISETTLSAGGSALMEWTKPRARIIVQVKASVAESQATYQLDYLGQKK